MAEVFGLQMLKVFILLVGELIENFSPNPAYE
jgi:hypothetical protein